MCSYDVNMDFIKCKVNLPNQLFDELEFIFTMPVTMSHKYGYYFTGTCINSPIKLTTMMYRYMKYC